MNNKGADQPAHPHSLISTFVVQCLDSMMPLVSISKISSLQLVSVAEQAGLSLTWWETSKTGFLATRLISIHLLQKVLYVPFYSTKLNLMKLKLIAQEFKILLKHLHYNLKEKNSWI